MYPSGPAGEVGMNFSVALLQAVRCNDRIAIKSQDLADRLWANTGLKAVFADIRKNGLHAIGLNPNVRFYR